MKVIGSSDLLFQVQGVPAVAAAATAVREAIANLRAAINAAAPPAAPAAAGAAGANPFAALFANAARAPPPGGAGAAPAAPPTADLAARYQAELAQLNDMGFHDADANIRALIATGGNVNAALEILLR